METKKIPVLFHRRKAGRHSRWTGVCFIAGLLLVNACASAPSIPASAGTLTLTASAAAASTSANGNSMPADTAASSISSAPTATSTIPSTATATSAPTITPTPPPVNPLTGLPVSDLALVRRRPIGIKVSEYPRTARPQAGLTDADVLFEYYQEKGDTRFQAIYLGRDSAKVGPIRSAREVDARLEQIFQSILVFNATDVHVWDWFNFQDVRRNTVYYTDDATQCPAMCSDPNQASINRIYANTVPLRQFAKEKGVPDLVPDLSGWHFQEEMPPMKSDINISTVRVRYLTNWATAEWRYNPDDHLYYRWSDTDQTPIYGDGPLNLGELTDRNNKQPITASNIIVLLTNYDRTQSLEIYDVQFFGSGTALFFRDGKMEEGSWRMPNSGLPRFFGNDSPTGYYMMRPGVSWITLVDDQSTYSIDGDTLKVEFSQPG